MDAGEDRDTLDVGEAPVDHYLLQFCPGGPGPDRILRQTSRAAAYWHRANTRRKGVAS
jgi:hypothetical protein